MHTTLFDHINGAMREASTYVLRFMPINLTPAQVYEGLLQDQAMAQAFKAAVKYLTPSSLNRRINVTVGGAATSLNLRLPSTEQYPFYLMPASTAATKITPESELGQALAIPLQVARDWESLSWVFNRMTTEVDVRALAVLFPWIVDLVEQWERDNPRPTTMRPVKPSKTRLEVERDIRLIAGGRVPGRFPRLTSDLSTLCKSGRTLFSQYRMIEASYRAGDLSMPFVTVERSVAIMPAWVPEHLDMVLADWREEEMDRIDMEAPPKRRK